jgi:hypothetical protein
MGSKAVAGNSKVNDKLAINVIRKISGSLAFLGEWSTSHAFLPYLT